MCQILLLLLGRDLRKLYSDGGRGKGGTNKSELFKLAAGKYEGGKKGECRVPFRVGKKSRSLKRDKVYRYLAKIIPN